MSELFWSFMRFSLSPWLRKLAKFFCLNSLILKLRVGMHDFKSLSQRIIFYPIGETIPIAELVNFGFMLSFECSFLLSLNSWFNYFEIIVSKTDLFIIFLLFCGFICIFYSSFLVKEGICFPFTEKEKWFDNEEETVP